MATPSGPGPAFLPLVLLDALIGYLALWQLLALSAVYLGASFDALFGLGFVAMAGMALPAVTRPWEGREVEDEVVVPPLAEGTGLAVLGVGAVATVSLGLSPAALAFASVPVAWMYAGLRRPVGGSPAPRAGRLDGAVIVVVGLLAALVASSLRRPDQDDAYYVSALLQSLAQPHRPVLGFDSIHGDPTAPIQQVIHRPQTYELLVAWWSRLLGLPGRWMYWVAAPALVASLTGLAHWGMVKRLAPRLGALAVGMALGVAVVWGDGHYTVGRFGFSRLFQGKSVFVSLGVPLLAGAMVAYGQRPDPRSWLRMAAAAFGVTAFTSTALVVVPVSLAFGALGALRLERRAVGATVAGWGAAVPVAGVLGLMYLELKQAGGLATEGFEPGATVSMGEERAGVVLAALGLLPWLMQGRGGTVWVARVLGPALLLLLNGMVPAMLGESAAKLMTWRTFWAVPFTPLLGLAAAAGLSAGAAAWRERRGSHGLRWMVTLGLVGVFVRAGDWAIEGKNISYVFAAEKTYDRWEVVADVVMAHAGPDAVVAAEPEVAQALVERPTKPKLVSVRKRFVQNLRRHWGKEEVKRRISIFLWTKGKKKDTPRRALDHLCVAVAVTGPQHRRGNAAEVLPRMGFQVVGEVSGRSVWVRDELPEVCGAGD